MNENSPLTMLRICLPAKAHARRVFSRVVCLCSVHMTGAFANAATQKSALRQVAAGMPF
ncbi:MAG: hypothetical protein ACOY90_04455 [Candidatus Zhuqueibacterota bacterium]